MYCNVTGGPSPNGGTCTCQGCLANAEIERWRRRAELAEGELEALSLSHRDLASRLAKMGNEQQPVSLAEMRQPEEREKNERMKALIDVVGQTTNTPPDDPTR